MILKKNLIIIIKLKSLQKEKYKKSIYQLLIDALGTLQTYMQCIPN